MVSWFINCFLIADSGLQQKLQITGFWADVMCLFFGTVIIPVTRFFKILFKPCQLPPSKILCRRPPGKMNSTASYCITV